MLALLQDINLDEVAETGLRDASTKPKGSCLQTPTALPIPLAVLQRLTAAAAAIAPESAPWALPQPATAVEEASAQAVHTVQPEAALVQPLGPPPTGPAVTRQTPRRALAVPEAQPVTALAGSDVSTHTAVTPGLPQTGLTQELTQKAGSRWKHVAEVGLALVRWKLAVVRPLATALKPLVPTDCAVSESMLQADPAVSETRSESALVSWKHAALPGVAEASGAAFQPPTAACQPSLTGLSFALSTTGEACQPHAALTALTEGKLQCAVTGSAFQHLLQHGDLSVLDVVLRNAAVFARMQPHQKGQVVDLLSFRGLHHSFGGQPRHVQVRSPITMYVLKTFCFV